jgi:hypothetical protein
MNFLVDTRWTLLRTDPQHGRCIALLGGPVREAFEVSGVGLGSGIDATPAVNLGVFPRLYISTSRKTVIMPDLGVGGGCRQALRRLLLGASRPRLFRQL